MDSFAQDPILYWFIWTIATVIGIILGWSIRGNWREKAILAAYEQSEQERNSVAHMFNQMRSQHDQKSAELKRLSLETNHLRQQLGKMQTEHATLDSDRELQTARLQKAQAEARHYAEKVVLLEENIKFLRMRDQQFGTEINRLHEEAQGWKKIQRDFSTTLHQLQVLENAAAQMQKERDALRLQVDSAKVEIANLQNVLALVNATAGRSSDSRDLTNPSGHFEDDDD